MSKKNTIPLSELHQTAKITQPPEQSENKTVDSSFDLVLPRLVLALQAARLGVWEFNVNTRKMIWDDRMYELFGINRNDYDLPSQVLAELLYPEDYEKYTTAVQQALTGIGSFGLELRVRWTDGSTHYLKSYAEVMPGLDGMPQIIIGANYDITEQKEAEFALQRNATRYRLLTESMQDVVWTLDPQTMQFTYVSPSVFKLRGFTPEEVMSVSFFQSVPPELVSVTGTIIQKQLEDFRRGEISSDQYFSFELQQTCKDAPPVWTEVISNYAINPETGLVEIRGLTRDISERKLSEEKIQRQLTELEVLYEIGLAISRLQDVRLVSQKALDILAQKMSWHHATIRQYIPHENRLNLLALHEPGLDAGKLAERFDELNRAISRPGIGLSGWVVANGRSVLCPDVSQNSFYRITYPGIQSGLYVPIKAGDQILGVISVESESASAFDEQDERFLTTIANQAAIAIENNGLFVQVQEKLAEKRIAEARLQASQARYRAIFDGAREGIVVIRLSSKKIEFANPAVCLMFEYSEREILSLSLDDLLDGAQMQSFWNNLETETGESSNPAQAISCRTQNGNEFYANITTGRIMIENEPYILGFFSDVTEQVQTNELIKVRLKFSDYSADHSLKELIQYILDEAESLTHSTVGFLHFISDNIIQLQAWSNNTTRTMCNMPLQVTHYPLEEAGIWVECVSAKKTLVYNNYQQVPQRKGLPDGHAPLERMITVPIIRNGIVKAVLGVGNKPRNYSPRDVELLNQLADSAWDISARKKAEEELHTALATLEQRVVERTAALQESEAHLLLSRDQLSTANVELEKAAHLKDEFLASTSHELRTPLTGILGLSEALHTQTYGELNEKQLKAVQNIESSGRHLLEMINDILDLSKIEAGKLEMQMEFCSLSEICQESLLLIREIANQKHQSISFGINPVTINLTTDPRRLKQMLVNLLSNAVKFMPEGGNLGLEVEGSQVDKQVRIVVWDEGVGIDAGDIPYLFQPFMQLENSFKRKYPGSGLGLALVKRMADLLNGKLDVESKPGKGSRFTITLPWRIHDTQPLRSESPLNLSIHTALSIEPNEIEAEHLTRLMRQLRVKNKIHPEIKNAIEIAALNQPDVIFLELHYTGVSGLEVLHNLKSDPRTNGIPVVLMSVEERREDVLQAGAAGFLIKPFTRKDLEDILDRVSDVFIPNTTTSETRMQMDKPLVFLVDDNPVVLETMADYLEVQHYRVEKADSALLLLEKGPALHPDIILMDIQMPDMDGLEATRRIRAHPDHRFAATPIVAVTALAMPGDRERCMAAGMYEYLTKPIRLSDLALRVHEILLQVRSETDSKQ